MPRCHPIWPTLRSAGGTSDGTSIRTSVRCRPSAPMRRRGCFHGPTRSVCRVRAGSAAHGAVSLVAGDARFALQDLILAHLFPEHLAADAKRLRGVLALPAVLVERRDDAVALLLIPAAAIAVFAGSA